jgi:UrcA family protein
MTKFLAISLALASLSGPALAAGDPLPRVAVPYADLDLSQPSDQERLETRVRNAVRSLCAPPARGLQWAQKSAECRQLAAMRAREQTAAAVAAATRDLSRSRFATLAGDKQS